MPLNTVFVGGGRARRGRYRDGGWWTVLKGCVYPRRCLGHGRGFGGVVLVVTGVWAFRRAKLVVIHTHDHDHGAGSHDHVHVHLAYDADRHATDHGNHGHAATSIGLLHGVAGSGHVWGLLPALALPPQHTVLYLGAFVVSSTVAMIAVSLGIGRLLRARTDVFMRSALRWSGGCPVRLVVCGSFIQSPRTTVLERNRVGPRHLVPYPGRSRDEPIPADASRFGLL